MSDLPGLDRISLPFWMGGEKAKRLASAAHEWFERLGQWAATPLRMLDPMTCSPRVLDLLAWQRSVTPYAGEPERLYRLRVAHAYANARDAGDTAGWKRIFKRLELGPVSLDERVDGQDWDIINVTVNAQSLSAFQGAMDLLVDEYGRTCRRYQFLSPVEQSVRVACSTFDDDHSTVCAVLETP